MGARVGFPRSGGDHGPDAFVGEHFEQEGVCHPAVEDVRLADPGAHRVHARRHLRDHARRDGTTRDEDIDLVGGDARQQRRRIGDTREKATGKGPESGVMADPPIPIK